MRIPVLRGVIDRRILANYRIDAAADLAATNPFRWNSLLTLRSAGVNQHTDSAAPYAISPPPSFRFDMAAGLAGETRWVGDVNNDGLDDVCWGSPYGNSAPSIDGAVEVLWDQRP